jgi:hypothetical protein
MAVLSKKAVIGLMLCPVSPDINCHVEHRVPYYPNQLPLSLLHDWQIAGVPRASEPARRLIEIEGIGLLTVTALVAALWKLLYRKSCGGEPVELRRLRQSTEGAGVGKADIVRYRRTGLGLCWAPWREL